MGIKFTPEEYTAAVREIYKEWQELQKEKDGTNHRLPDFEVAIDHVARFGIGPIDEEA
jgi:hypothetical protein